METDVIARPTYVVALSEKELKAALDDASALQAALRRQYLDAQGIAPLALPAGAARKNGKMGGAKMKKARPKKVAGDPAGSYPCPHCDAVRKTQPMLARHVRTVHRDLAAE